MAALSSALASPIMAQPFRWLVRRPCIFCAFKPQIQSRAFSESPLLGAANKERAKAKADAEKAKRRKRKHTTYKYEDIRQMDRFTLCDAMRYIRAFEVGHPPDQPKYEVAIRLKTKKDGPVVRNQIRLPNPVKTDIRIAVVCPPDSPAAKAAKAAGATYVGDEEIFTMVKDGKIDFERCIAQPDMLAKMTKAGIPRILGPRGLMPSVKLGTVVDNIGGAVRNMLSGSMYRERQGVVRMAVGRLSYTPEQLRDNVKTLVEAVKKDAAALSDQTLKSIFEVVLSSTHAPGFSLNGLFKEDPSQSSANPARLSQRG